MDINNNIYNNKIIFLNLNNNKSYNNQGNNNQGNNNFVFDPQQAAFCGGHAINNLLQNMVVTYGIGSHKGEFVKGLLNLDFVAQNMFKFQRNVLFSNNKTKVKKSDFYNSSGNYNINVLVSAINELNIYDSDVIYNYSQLKKMINNSKLIGFIVNTGGHYVAVRVKPFKVNNKKKCNLHLNNPNQNHNIQVAIIDSKDGKCKNKQLNCQELDTFMGNYFDISSGGVKQGYGCLYVLEK